MQWAISSIANIMWPIDETVERLTNNNLSPKHVQISVCAKLSRWFYQFYSNYFVFFLKKIPLVIPLPDTSCFIGTLDVYFYPIYVRND